MSTFKVTTDQGIYNVTVEGDMPPSEQEILDFISSQKTKPQPERVNPEIDISKGESYIESRKRKLSEVLQGIKNIPQNIAQSNLVQDPVGEAGAMATQFGLAPILDVPRMGYNVAADLFNKVNPLESMFQAPSMPELMSPQTGTQRTARLLGDLFAPGVAGKIGELSKKPLSKTLPLTSDIPEEVYIGVMNKPYLMDKNAPTKIGKQIGDYNKQLHGTPLGKTPVDNRAILNKIYEEGKNNDFGGQSPLTKADWEDLQNLRVKASKAKTLEQLQGLKKDLQENYISWTTKGDSYNRMMQSIADDINTQIASLYPELANANSDYSFLMQHQDDLKYLNSYKGALPRRQQARTGISLGMGMMGMPMGMGGQFFAATELAQSPLLHAQAIKYARPLTSLFKQTAPLSTTAQQ